MELTKGVVHSGNQLATGKYCIAWVPASSKKKERKGIQSLGSGVLILIVGDMDSDCLHAPVAIDSAWTWMPVVALAAVHHLSQFPYGIYDGSLTAMCNFEGAPHAS
ncbi:uncharacterized protein LOC125516117 [Triticum urartu]|uniref:uncharacterized protein LOC125516117 n=1 Tax=Triticum urartu TaxID=4572 RepID=UPI002043D2A1|nr:uncharacterized protein LOC125516117 [Triticum urartu]